MAIIEKKIWPEYFRFVQSGKKGFELRVADFRIREGDTLVLREWDPKTKRYTGKTLRRKVTFVLKFSLNAFGQKKAIEKKGLYAIQL